MPENGRFFKECLFLFKYSSLRHVLGSGNIVLTLSTYSLHMKILLETAAVNYRSEKKQVLEASFCAENNQTIDNCAINGHLRLDSNRK